MNKLGSISCVVLMLLCILPAQRQKSRPPEVSQLTILGVTVGEDNLETLQKKFGAVKQCHTEEHVSTAGYKNSKQELIFEFSEVGGGDITGFYLKLADGASSCALSILPANAQKLVTEGGVHLGMKEEEFLRMFGSPKSKNKRGEWKYYWTWETSLSNDEKKKAAASSGATVGDKADVSISVEARFANSALEYFYISKLETL